MTLQDCYTQLHGDYAEAIGRLMNERLMDRFVRKFPADPSMGQLNEMIAAGDNPAAFRAVHTLKGVAANLSFTELYRAAYDLTEQMRDLQHTADAELYSRVQQAYDLVIKTLNQYTSEKS